MNNIFSITFKDNWFKQNDVLTTPIMISVRVIDKPKRKLAYRILQFLTFGIYKASWYYKAKVIE